MSMVGTGPAIVGQAARPAARAFSVRTASDVDTFAAAWAGLAADGHATPFQQPGFVAAVLHSGLDGPGASALLVLVEDRDGRPLALFPFTVSRSRGLCVARFAGGAHASYRMGLFAREAVRMSPADWARALADAGRKHGIDVFALCDQPVVWQGFDNPLAGLSRQASPSRGYRARLLPDARAFLRSRMSGESLKKLKRKEKRLAELGELRLVEPLHEAEIQPVLDAYLRQKAARFQALGMVDPFAAPEVRAFLARATAAGVGTRAPAISLHALLAGERVLAVFGGASAAGRFSAMFTSFDGAPDVARFSPGDCLLMRLVSALCERGYHTFDLGVGDAAYKADYCDESEELFDCWLPLTARGRVAALAFSAMHAAKRRVKASAPLMRALAALRRLRAG
jgi:CelD/BcsL family acetyltransferase involved in cellulose biosynthesis